MAPVQQFVRGDVLADSEGQSNDKKAKGGVQVGEGQILASRRDLIELFMDLEGKIS